MTTTTFDILEMIDKLRHDESLSAREALNQLALDLKRRFEDGYFGDLYRTDFVVEGTGEFPFDMLRYTSSWPKGESDSFAMSEGEENTHLRRRVTLSRYHRDPQPVLSEARWESKFRWRVVEVIETVQV